MHNQFHLDRVLDPEFYMPYCPELKQVAFLSITLLPIANDQMLTLNFLADIPLTAAALQHRIGEYTPLAYLSVLHLALEFRFADDESPEGRGVIRCELTSPDQHNLHDLPRQRQILQYLYSWGLCDEHPNAVLTQPAKAG